MKNTIGKTKHRQKAKSLCLLLALAVSGPLLGTSDGSLLARAATKSVSATGLDSETLKLANRGDWVAAIDRLQGQRKRNGLKGYSAGWLAFALMFQGRCQDLNELTADAATIKEIDARIVAVVKVFDLICQNKLDEADKALQTVAADAKDDVLVNFAEAALAGKRGQASKAIEYCRKMTELAPDFAWGYRTVAYMEDRWLKDTSRAESDYARALAIEPAFQEARDSLVDLRLISNNFDGAIDVALTGIKCEPSNAKGYYRLGQIYMQQWRLREALVLLQKAIALAPGEAKYHRARATILRYQGDLGGALKEQQAAVDLSKDKAFELVEMAQLNLAAGNANRAADNLRDALALDPQNSTARQKLIALLTQEQRFEDLVLAYRQAIEKKPKDASLHLGLARALKETGKLDQAIDELKESVNLDNKDPVPHREIGTILIGRKDFMAAAKEYTRALNINPSSVEDLVSLGYCYAQNEDYLQAEAAMVTAIALQQLSGSQSTKLTQLDLMRSLAALLLEEGRYADAASQLEGVCAASKVAAANPQDQFLLAQAKALRDRSSAGARELLLAFESLPSDKKQEEKYSVAESLLIAGKADMALEFIGKQPGELSKDDQFLVDSSRAYLEKQDLEKSLTLAKQAVSNSPAEQDRASDAQVQLARVLLAKGDIAGADAAAKKAYDLNPKSFTALALSARICLKKSDAQQALAQGKRALELNPYYTDAYLLVGDANAAGNKWKEAAESYKKATELYPALLDAHKALLSAYKKLSLNEEVTKEQEQISQIEKRD